jgi:hypothetical protein
MHLGHPLPAVLLAPRVNIVEVVHGRSPFGLPFPTSWGQLRRQPLLGRYLRGLKPYSS